jgi:RHS repeat-associated protein
LGGKDVAQGYKYDSIGRVVSVSHPHSAALVGDGTTTYRYDALDRVVEIQRPGSNSASAAEFIHYSSRVSLTSDSSEWISDGTSELSQFVDAEGNWNAVAYDQLGNPVRTIDGTGGVNNYVYDAFGLLRRIENADGGVTVMTHDSYGRRRAMRDSNTGTSLYTYTTHDELDLLTDAKDQVSNYDYDSLGRLVTLTNPDGVTTWEYDGTGPNEIGRLMRMTSPGTAKNPAGQQVRYGYEPPLPGLNRGYLTSITHVLDGRELVTRYDYDSLARLHRVHYPTAGGTPVSVQYSYDGPHVNGVYSVSGDAAAGSATTLEPLWRITAADQAHRIKTETFGTGATTTYDYEFGTGRVSSILTRRGDTTIQSLAYGYYENGLVRTRSTPAQQDEYVYDRLNRLAAVRRGGPGQSLTTEEFSYNRVGSMREQSSLGTYTYPEASRPQLVQAAGEQRFDYDASGNLTSRRRGGVDETITYTAFDMPKSVAIGDSGGTPQLEFDYDAAQSRVVKRTATQTTYYAGELYRRVVPTSGDEQQRFAVYAGGRQVAELGRVGAINATDMYAIHADALGSVTSVTTATSNFAQEFSAFGKISASIANQTGITSGFTGHEHDEELGLINMRGRIYDPVVARFTTADPVMQYPFSTQGTHRYSYVQNAPTTYTDPTGWWIDSSGAASYAWGACASNCTAGAAAGSGFAWSSLLSGGAMTLMNIGGHELLKMGVPQPGTIATATARHSPTTTSGARSQYDATAQNRPGELGARPFPHESPAAGRPVAGEAPDWGPADWRDVVARLPWSTSERLAAYTFLDRWNPASIARDREYYTLIVERGGRYAALPVQIGTAHSSEGFNEYIDSFNSARITGVRLVASVHTHGAESPGYLDGQFSPGDVATANYYELRSYLGTPAGRFLVLRPGQTVGTDLGALPGTNRYSVR